MTDTPLLIRRIRQDRGLTLGDVAKRMDCAPATVSRWEREPSRVTVPVLRNLARVLDCDVADLLRAGRARAANTLGVGIVRVDPVLDEGEPCFLSRETLAALTDTPLDKLRALRVVGDAMMPTLRDGDLCIIDTSAGIERSGLYCIMRGELAGVRRVNLMVNPAEVTISVDNPQYSPSSQVALIGDLEIVGRVLYRLGTV